MSFSAAKLRDARLRLGRSQREVSAVAQATISAIESGRQRPHPSTLRKLADEYGVEVSDFFEEVALAAPLGESGSDDTRIRAWLRENGAKLGALTDEEFSRHAAALDPAIDDLGNPLGVMKAHAELTQESAETLELLRAPKRYKSLGPLLPTTPGASIQEQKMERQERLQQLRKDLGRSYRHRISALAHYANVLAKEQEALGKSPGYFRPARLAELFQEALEKAKAA
ncbi:MAG: helix-turn-helix domain-containing protein [Actinomycetota bacterium]|jgi:transcriptional regulator with XRE-family HTH domain|nr:helix-turn-helix domain-containing protein [Actinomycetota bacterium]